MAAETGVAGGALIKGLGWLGLPLGAGSLAAAIGFAFIPSRSPRESVMRVFVAILGSASLGTIFYFAFAASDIGAAIIAVAAQEVAGITLKIPFTQFHFLITSSHVKLSMAAPFLVSGGLPFWWLLGAAFRWIDKRKDKDIAELVDDAGKTVKQAKENFWP